jgi:hypothetical protein
MKKPLCFYVLFCTALILFLSAPISAKESGPNTAPQYGKPPQEDLGKIAKQLNNPVSSLWSLVFQNDFSLMKGELSPSHRGLNNFKFQPVLPVPLGKKINMITRPVFQLISAPYLEVTPPAASGATPRLQWDRETGLGDTVLMQLFAPAGMGNWVYGLGPTWIFPTATDDVLGQGKWQVGPAGVFMYLGQKWILGFIGQQWWSFAGDEDRAYTSTLNFQYIIQYRITSTWQIGMAPNMIVDWYADDDNKLSLPVGLGSSVTLRLGKMPVKFGFEVQYYAIRPDNFGPEWNFKVSITPVIPSPFLRK